MNPTKAETMANDLLGYYALTAWKFKYSRGVNRFGFCSHSRRLISLSKPLTELNNEATVLNTILHEIAHALAPVYEHHGEIWRRIALEIGCDGKRLYDETVIRPSHKYLGTCPKCGRTIKRYRRKAISCGRCSRTFDPALLFRWTLLS